MSIITVYDCTGANLGKFPVPAGIILAGYDTGSSGIAWTPEQYAQHPDAIHIDQDPAASDYTADWLDSERGAVTPGSPKIAEWYKKALANYQAGKRPGQRHPSVYQSASNVTANVNALIAWGITSGPGLVVANWNIGDPAAVAEVQASSGPFPVIGVQWHNTPLFDVSVVSGAWLAARSRAPGPQPPPVFPRSQMGWKWCHRCGSLFFSLDPSRCPAAPGPHDGSQSANYAIQMVAAK